MRNQQNTGGKLFTTIYFLIVEAALIQWLDFSLSVKKAGLLNISLPIVNCFTEGKRGQV